MDNDRNEHVDVCDRCGTTTTDVDAGFCPSMLKKNCGCGGKWMRMESYNLRNDEGRDIKFIGHIIADVSSHTTNGPSQNRWTEITIYRTKGGKIIVQIVGRTQWQGESDRHEVSVCETEAEVIKALEYPDDGGILGWLAKDALDEAGIDHETVIE